MSKHKTIGFIIHYVKSTAYHVFVYVNVYIPVQTDNSFAKNNKSRDPYSGTVK